MEAPEATDTGLSTQAAVPVHRIWTPPLFRESGSGLQLLRGRLEITAEPLLHFPKLQFLILKMEAIIVITSWGSFEG